MDMVELSLSLRSKLMAMMSREEMQKLLDSIPTHTGMRPRVRSLFKCI